MMKLALTPDQDGYQLDGGLTAVQSKLMGGGMRLRRDLLNAVVKVSVSWTCSVDEYEYLQTFKRSTSDGSDPFLMDLIVDTSVLTEHTCRVIPGTWKLGTVKGGIRKVSAQLEVVPLPADDAYDEGLVTSYEAFGNETSEALSLLATIVNVDMPANIK